MENLFLLLFLASFICLIIGLVKPTFFSRFIKGEITKKKIGLIFGIATVVFFVMFGMTTDTNKQTQLNTNEKAAEQKIEPKQLSPEEQAKKAEAEAAAKKIADEEKAKTYSTISLTDVTVSNDHVTIVGTTDLPDGAKLATSFDVWGRSTAASWIGSEGEAQVSKGGFTSTLVIPQRDEFAKGPYEISILFTPIGGTEQITNLVGKKWRKFDR
ncbi:hypothetical protein KKH59_00780 [Patescibacteria group bacterium]|nr:hypothetical protein [Patescibacteria group bacterium]